MKRLRALHFGFLLAIVASCIASIVTLSQLSIRLDEAQSLWVATKSVPMILQLIAQDVHVPIYELILHFWIQILGNSILSARLLSFLFFLITLPLLYKLAKSVSNKTVALFTVALFSLSPFIMWYSSEARMYTLFALITTLNHFFFLQFIRSNGRSGKFGYFLTTVFGMYTHYFFIFLIATQVIFLFGKQFLQRFLHLTEKDEHVIEPVWNWRMIATFFGLLCLAALFFLPWGLYFLSQGAAADTRPLIPPPTSYNLFQTIVNFLFGFQSQGIQSLLISLWPLSVLILFLLFTKRKRTDVLFADYFALVTFLPIVLVFIASFIRPIFLSRYLILVTPTLFFLIAWLLLSYIKRFATLIVGLLLVGMFGLLLYQNLSTTTPVKEDYSGVSSYLEKKATPSDIIAVSSPFTIYPIEYTYSGSTRITTIPIWDRYSQGAIPPFSEQSLTKQIDSLKKQYDDIFVVLSYDQGYQDKIVQYLDSHYALLSKEAFTPGLQVREYRLRYDTLSSL